MPVSLSLNAFGFLFLSFAFITFNFPEESPVNEESMNYTSAAIGIIGLLAMATWFTTARKRFTGPSEVRGLVVQGVAVPPAAAENEPTPEKKQ